tara:strand:- start:1785 stop:2027 length:243 start_codon:yes stop_codon:yes gene_type:complete
MKMKSTAALLAMYVMAGSHNNGFGDIYQPPTKEEIEKKKAIALKARNLKQGVSEYFYGIEVVYARNQKNADKKARKKGYL